MKILSRDFTKGEKAILLLLVIALVILAYYLAVHKPVKEGIEKANAESANLRVELSAVEAKAAVLERMQNEIDGIMENSEISMMPSYNNKQEVNKLISGVLGNLTYSASLANLQRSGDLIRRNVQLEFNAPSYAAMEEVLEKLSSSPYRCLIDNVTCSRYRDKYEDVDAYKVSLTATFFETLVGGAADEALPADSSAKK